MVAQRGPAAPGDAIRTGGGAGLWVFLVSHKTTALSFECLQPKPFLEITPHPTPSPTQVGREPSPGAGWPACCGRVRPGGQAASPTHPAD